jgi:hypothetical protein
VRERERKREKERERDLKKSQSEERNEEKEDDTFCLFPNFELERTPKIWRCCFHSMTTLPIAISNYSRLDRAVKTIIKKKQNKSTTFATAVAATIFFTSKNPFFDPI